MKQIFILVFSILSVSAFTQKVNGKLQFQKGQKLEMIAENKAVITQEIMGQAIEMNMNSSFTRSFDVEDVKNNTATIEHKVKRIQFNFDAMGQSQSFDSDKEEDLKSDIGKNMEKKLKNKYKMVVDANGKILSVKADDDNPNGKSDGGDNDMMSGMMAQFADGLDLPKEGDISSFKILPDKELIKGSSWTDSLGKGGIGNYTITDITGIEILIDFTEESALETKQELMGTEANLNMKLKNTGKIVLDKKTGLLKLKTSNLEGTGTVDVMGQSIPMKTKATGSVTVK